MHRLSLYLGQHTVSQIGYVGQEPVLFAGTIALNIANGKQGATEDESESPSLYVLLPWFFPGFSLILNDILYS